MKHIYVFAMLFLTCIAVTAQSIHLNESGFTQTPELSESARRVHPNLKDAKRVRPFRLNTQIKQHQTIEKGDHIVLDLFDDEVHAATVLNKRTDINQVTVLTLKLQAYTYAYAYIALSPDSFLVTVDIPEEQKKFSSRASVNTPESYMLQLDEAVFRQAGCGAEELQQLLPGIAKGGVPNLAAPSQTLLGRNTSSSPTDIPLAGSCLNVPDPNDPAVITLMILYTQEAQTWSDANTGGIANSIATTLALANQVSVNNNLGITFQLVHSELVTYTQQGLGSDWINLLTDGDGILDEVHTLRPTHAADLVSLLTHYTSGGTAGIADLLTSKYGNNRAVFSATRINFAVNTITFIHEIGHNLGAMHNLYQTSDPGPTQWENWAGNTWSAGWRWQGTDTNYYADLMSYPSGSEYADGQPTTNIPYFSDPLHTHMGAAAGDALLADNARTLREIKHFIARYDETIAYCNAGNAPLYATTSLYLDQVSMGAINNVSGASSVRYGDFTALATCMQPGDTQTLEISVVNHANGRPVSVWIDWNGDDIFDTSTELMYHSALGAALHTTDITAPLGVSPGLKRMRIRTYSNSTAPVVDGPCGYSGIGEVEDYSINLEAPDPCTPGAIPQNLMAGDSSNSTVYLSWDAVPGVDYYELRYREVGATVWQTVSPIWYPYHTLSNLVFETDYEAEVRVVCAGTPESYSAALLFSTTGYCASSGGDIINILNVTFGDINQSSPGAPTVSSYTDFTTVSTAAAQGQTYALSINAPGPPIGKNFRVWIDFNLNASFEDAGELVLDVQNTTQETVAGNITIPQGASLGNARMRVSVKMYTALQGPCDTFDYGEVEDYTVVISETLETSSAGFGADFVLYPNPTSAVFSIATQQLQGATVEVSVRTVSGQRVYAKPLSVPASGLLTVDIQGLAAGMYFVELTDPERGRFVSKLLKK